MDTNKLFAGLNALFPPLARWHECLLIAALLISVLASLELYRSGWQLVCMIPGLLWLRLLWRKVPAPGWGRWSWALATGIWGAVVTGIALKCTRVSPDFCA